MSWLFKKQPYAVELEEIIYVALWSKAMEN